MNIQTRSHAANVIIDAHILEDDDEWENEARAAIETGLPGLEAAVVFRDDDLEFVELRWSAESGYPFPLSPEILNSVLFRAASLGYPLASVARRGAPLNDGQAFVERLIVTFVPEPSEGDGMRIAIRIELGIDLEDDDYGTPDKAKKKRNDWCARVQELVTRKYPNAELSMKLVDDDADDVTVSAPVGIDPTDFEWEIEDLIDQATEEIL